MSVGLALLAGHLLADFPLQTDEMAQKKFDDTEIRLLHVWVHWVIALVVLAISWNDWKAVLTASSFIALAHYMIDTQRWAEPKDGFEDYPIWVDQSLHIASLAIAVLVWGPA